MQSKTCVICKSVVEYCVCGFDTMTKTELFLLQLRLSDLYIKHPGKLELERVPADSVIHEPGVGEMHKVAPDYSGVTSSRLNMRPEDVLPPKTADVIDRTQHPTFRDLASLIQRPRSINREETSLEYHRKYPQMNVNDVFGFQGPAGEFSGVWVATDVKVFHIERGPKLAISEVTAKNIAGKTITFRTAWDNELVASLSPGFVDSGQIKRLPSEWVEVSMPEVNPFPLLEVGKRIKTAEGADDSVITVTGVKLLQYNYGICNPEQYQMVVQVSVQQTTERGQVVGDTSFFTNNFTHTRAPLEPQFFPYKDIIAVE